MRREGGHAGRCTEADDEDEDDGGGIHLHTGKPAVDIKHGRRN